MDRIEEDDLQLHGSPAVRALLIVLGWVFVAIGIVGVVLPLLPTTPFLILAAACFARGSERFYRWLLASRLFGPVIREWRRTRSVPRWAKRTALALIALTFGSTVAFFAPNTLVRIVVAACGLVALVAVGRLRVREPAPDLEEAAAPVE